MTVDLAKNGDWALTLKAGDAIEQMVLDQFAARAANGTTVALTKAEDGGLRVQMAERKS